MHATWARNAVESGKIDPKLAGHYDGGSGVSGARTVNNMLKAGWIRVDGHEYHGASGSFDQHAHKAVAHAEKHLGPYVRSVTYIQGDYPDGMHNGRKSSLKVNQPKNEMVESAPYIRGFIAPDGTHHTFDGGFEMHAGWAKSAVEDGRVDPKLVGHTSAGFISGSRTVDNMLKAGWIRVDGTDYHSMDFNHDTRARALAHVKQHNPDLVSRAVFQTGGYPQLAARSYWLHDDPPKNESMEASPERSWITPDGKEHAITGLVSHTAWLRDNKHLVPKPIADQIDHGHDPVSVMQSLMKDHHWIRKSGPFLYDTHHEQHIPKIIKHWKVHHDDGSEVNLMIRTGRSGFNVGDAGSWKDRWGDDRNPDVAWGRNSHSLFMNSDRPGDQEKVKRYESGVFESKWWQQNEEYDEEHEERGWIHPSGRYHQFHDVMETHGSWAKKNLGKVKRATPDAIKYWGNDSSTGERDIIPMETAFGMLSHGWVRKTYTNQYHIGRGEDLHKVMKHVAKHHPEHDQVHVIVGPHLERDCMHYRMPVEDHKKIRKLAGSALQDHFDAYEANSQSPLNPEGTGSLTFEGLKARFNFGSDDRGWIDPNGEYHHIGGEAHGRWTGDRGMGSLFDVMGVGWVRKADKNQYHVDKHHSGTIHQLPMIMSHVREHHPEVKTIHLIHGMHPDHAHRFNLPVKDPSEYEGHTPDSLEQYKTNKEYSEFRPMSESRADMLIKEFMQKPLPDFSGPAFLQKRHHGWITPQDHHIPLGAKDHHNVWAMRDLGKSDRLARFAGPDKSLQRVTRDMVGKGGWIRKFSHDCYTVKDNSHVHRALKHVDRVHPSVNGVRVSTENDMGTFNIDRNADGSWNWPSEHGDHTPRYNPKNESRDYATDRAWISPGGEVHAVGQLGSHTGWISKTKEENPDLIPGKGLDIFGTIDAMRDAGWIQKHGPSVYSARPHALDRLKTHVETYHPDEKNVTAFGTGKKKVEHQWVDESRADQLIKYVLDESTFSQPPRYLPRDNNAFGHWLNTREHAWISPEGEYHKLDRGEHHAEACAKLSGGQFADGEVHRMVQSDWIRKGDRAMYFVKGDGFDPHASPNTKRVIDHVNARHPEVNKFAIHYQEEDDTRSRDFTRQKDGTFHVEPDPKYDRPRPGSKKVSP